MPLHDIHYQHWQGASTGLWRRRWVIARNGLAACMQNRVMRVLVMLCWSWGLFMVAGLFFISQLLVPDSMVVKWVSQLNPSLQSFAKLLITWLHDHPEISVRTTQNILFYYGCAALTPAAVFALGVAMPLLVTRDLGTSAIVVYSSKALTRWDYVLGKYFVALGVMAITWLAPLCVAWLAGNLLAPDWNFFWHSRVAIGNVLLYGLVSMSALSLLALGVSAVSSSEKATPALWFAWFLLGYVIQPIATHTKPWLRHLSFNYNLEQFRLATFRLADDVKTAQDHIPILGTMLSNISQKTMDSLAAPSIQPAGVSLALMLAVAIVIINKKEPAPMSAIIKAVELSRWYGVVMGLNNVSFEVEGGLTGLVGPNGAGKSTLIQIVTGQLQPSSGELTVFGERPWNNPALLRRLGYCPEGEAVPAGLRPLDWLCGLALISGLSPAMARSRCETMLDRVRLPREAWSRRMGQYSKGMKQRAKLAQALVHQPELLVLDEPMNGLDPMGRQEMAQTLKALAAEGVHIIISSHILAELESLCKNILVLNWGRILASGSQREVRADIKNWSEELAVQCDDAEKLARHLFDAGVLLGFDLADGEGFLRIRVKDAAAFYERWVDLLLQSGVTVHAIRSRSRSLQNIYDKVTTA